MLRALGRVVRDAPEVAWPYLGYGVEFLFVPPDSLEAIAGMLVRRAALVTYEGTPTIHSTVRRELWIYEILEPIPSPRGLAGGDPPRAARGLAPRARQPLLRRGGTVAGRDAWPRPAPSSSATADACRASRSCFRCATPRPPCRECLASLAGADASRTTRSSRWTTARATGAARSSRPRPGRPARCGSLPRRPGPRPRRALNAGLALVAGPLVARMDADDVAHPDAPRAPGGASRGRTSAPTSSARRVRLVGEPRPGERRHAGLRRLAEPLLDHDAIVRDLFVESPLVHPSVDDAHRRRCARSAATATSTAPRTTTSGCAPTPPACASRRRRRCSSTGATRAAASPAPTRATRPSASAPSRSRRSCAAARPPAAPSWSGARDPSARPGPGPWPRPAGPSPPSSRWTPTRSARRSTARRSWP